MRHFLVAFIVGFLALGAFAQERIDLSVAETKPSNAQYRVERLTIQYDDPATTPGDEGFILLQLVGQNSEPVSCVYNAASNPTGTFLVTALNKANLSAAYNNNTTTGSLKQRIFHRLVVMGESTLICGKTLTGSLAGSVP